MKNKKDIEFIKKVKEFEAQKRKNRIESNEVKLEIKEENLMDFDAWWSTVKNSIPPAHKKEIIWADFKARKLSNRETKESYDAALKKYGLSI